MADKWGAVTGADGELDGCVYKFGKICDAVFEDVVDDLHDAGGVLEEGNFRTFVHLEGTIKQAIFGLDIKP
jgi:hypothetical protein